MKKIVILGAGGFARELKLLIDVINKEHKQYDFLGYLVSDTNKLIDRDSKDEVIGDFSWFHNQDEKIAVALGIGNPQSRLSIANTLSNSFDNIEFPSIVHPNVIYDASTCLIEKGVIVCASTILTVNVKLEKFSMLNLACTIGHEAIIGPGSVLNPTVNISGGVKIGRSVLVGTGAQVLQYLSIGDNSTVGAGACVTKDLPNNVVAVGIPAKIINHNEKK